MAYRFIQAANYWTGREGYTPRYLILHGTAGFQTAYDVAMYFARPSTLASVHHVFGRDGDHIQCVDERDAAWGNGGITAGHDPFWNEGVNPNLITISFEHVKPSLDNSDAITEAQLLASVETAKEVCARWGIPKRRADASGGITGHFSMDPVNRSRCPGPFPWDRYFSLLNQEEEKANDMLELTDPYAKQYFKDVGNGRWQCTNGNTLQGNILKFYRSIGGAPRLPLTNEMKNVPGIVWQRCESSILVYDPKNQLDGFSGPYGCYLLKLDAPLAQQLLAAPYQTQIKTAQTAQQEAEHLAASFKKELEQLKAMQPVDRAVLKSSLQAIETTLQSLLIQL